MWTPPSLESLSLNPPKNTKSFMCGSKLEIHLSSPFYQAGDTIQGRIILDVAPHNYIGNICVGLRGEEEITYPFLKSKDPFLHSFSIIQDALGTPINNITGVRHYTYSGYRKAIPGKIIIPFQFALPIDLPSTNSFKKTCSIKYSIICLCEIMRYTDPKLLVIETTVKIVEKFNDFHHPFFSTPISGDKYKQVLFTPGIVHLNASVARRGMNSFSKNYIKINVRNASLSKVHGVTIKVIKSCAIPYLPGYILPSEDFSSDVFEINHPEKLEKSKVVWRKTFSGARAQFDPGESRAEVLEFFCPEHCITGRLTSLFYISMSVEVSLHLGLLTKSLKVNLPIVVRPFGSAFVPPSLRFEEPIHPFHYNHLYLTVGKDSNNEWLNTNSHARVDLNRSDELPWGSGLEDQKLHKPKKLAKIDRLVAKFKHLKTKASFEHLHNKPFIVFKNKTKNNYYGFSPSDVNLWEYRLTGNLPELSVKTIIQKGNNPIVIHPTIYFNSDERCKRSFFEWYFGNNELYQTSDDASDIESDYYGKGWWCDLENKNPPHVIVESPTLKTKPSWGDWLKDSQQSLKKRKSIPKEWQRC